MRRSQRLEYAMMVAGALVLLARKGEGATLAVDLNGTADYTDIQSAIDAAKDGDMVLVRPGEYVIAEPINFNRFHIQDDPATPPVKNIIVKSEGGPEVTTIRMSEATRTSMAQLTSATP